MDEVRQVLANARRLVVKVGSRALTAHSGQFESLAAQLAEQRDLGRDAVLVSSGAIALGQQRLSLPQRPNAMALLQAAAAAGQAALIRSWETAFAPYGLVAAQVLLTHADMADRDRYLNARAAIDALLELHAVPVINENDCVSVDEIRFGDNDQLAAMVATLVGADLLVLLTDVDGVLDDNDRRVPIVQEADDIERWLRPSEDKVGTGGMKSKLDASRRATKHGVPVVIANADERQLLASLLRGEDVGTLVLPHGAKLASRKHWIAYTLKPKGDILLDRGAAEALAGSASLLAAGVLAVRGDFDAGDLARLIGPDGHEIGRGLTRYDTSDVARLAGASGDGVAQRLGRSGSPIIVHRDDLVLADRGTL